MAGLRRTLPNFSDGINLYPDRFKPFDACWEINTICQAFGAASAFRRSISPVFLPID
jgi:hypothetical protein